jgi:enoyl-[acyl-carrier protein] reductase II
MEKFGELQIDLVEKRRKKAISHAEAQHDVETFWMGALRKGVQDGDVEYGSLMAGQSIGLVDKVRPLKEALEYLIQEAEEELIRVKRILS